MKKIMIIIFLMFPLYAGRVYIGDPKEKLNEMDLKLQSIRTRLGYGIPPEEETEILSFHAKLKLVKEFNGIWAEYISMQELLKKSFSSNEYDQETFTEFDARINKDKRCYAGLCIQGLINLRRAINQLSPPQARENRLASA